jgi:hypothetical protein
MMIVLSPADFHSLSLGCQQEILGLLTRIVGPELEAGTNEPVTSYGDPLTYVSSSTVAVGPQETGSDSDKRVVNITTEQARELIANISEKSQKTLRLFAAAERVGLDELVGGDGPYKDMNDLKRSFVGAVNRRLRTVVGNRSVVLFGSDRDRRRIRVLPLAAAALRHAMGIPEPDVEEVFEGFDADSCSAPESQ